MAKNNDKKRMADIARIIGVSPGTVSNAINNRKGVSELKRQEILRVAQSLGYKQPVYKRLEKTLRFVIIKRHGAVVDDTPFFYQLIKGIEIESKKNGYELLVSHVTADASGSILDKGIFFDDSCDGIIILATELLSRDLNNFENCKSRILLLDSYFRNTNYDCVVINNEDGAYQATKFLIDQGHRRIGLFHSSNYINNFYYRRKGFYQAISDYKVELNPKYIIDVSSTMEGAYQDMINYLGKNGTKELPTAFFAENDIIAVGVMRALKEANIDIPNDISVIGFDDMPYCEASSPRLTTVRVDKIDMGRMAVHALVNRINEVEKASFKIEICTNLVLRDSVKKNADLPDIIKSEYDGIL